MKKPETLIVQAILARIFELGGDGYHVHGSMLQRAGEPDIDASVPDLRGKHLHIKCEVKVPGEKPSPLQQHRLEEYRKRGYTAFWCTSVEEFERAIGH